MSASYSFREVWEVAAPLHEVQAVLVDLEHYSSWWPEIRAVAKIDDDTARVLCRSALPHTLDLVLHAVHREPQLLEIALSGDLIGTARWRLTPTATGTLLEFEQDVVVAHWLLTVASYVARPLLRWNHHRMMATCVKALPSRVEALGSGVDV